MNLFRPVRRVAGSALPKGHTFEENGKIMRVVGHTMRETTTTPPTHVVTRMHDDLVEQVERANARLNS